MNGVLISAPAKLNLTLEVTGKLENGYHTLDMLMQTVDLCEKIIVTKAEGITVHCIGSDGEPLDGIPADRHNTAFKAAMLFFEAAEVGGGAKIDITKEVPVGAGMGGGSADAAGVLAGLNELYGRPLTQERLLRLGKQAGADVPFALTGGTARVRGIGEQIEAVKAPPACVFCVAMPPKGCGTQEGYAKYDALGGGEKPDNGAAVAALEKNDLAALCGQMKNELEKPCATEETAKLTALLRENGAMAALMTGSGAAVYGVFADQQAASRAARAVPPSLASVRVLHPVQHGPVIENIF
ncbi:MAG: 4-(cytidine 5'-diphospho)-2-C-methyl-D-erythritol kinase [Oscillospiraceae bacterium]|nr:4-(cytidine 5'-diphospho)-2-C-methyl-D-erythritol kinase [Oscillospiraceae bacterium]